MKLKGTTTGAVTRINAKVGKKKLSATGTASWSLKLKKLKLGKNKVVLTASGPGGVSAPVKVTIVRK